MQSCAVVLFVLISIRCIRTDDSKHPQPSVISSTKQHALYLWIYTNSDANAKEVAKVVANLQAHVDYVSPPDQATEANKLIAGVGFGEAFYKKVAKEPREFSLTFRRGLHGNLPATGGDIFIHAKSDSYSKLFELSQVIKTKFPPNSIDVFDDIYGFVYKDSRDLSGFIDGTENPKEMEERKEIAVEKNTGGSFLLTQRWIHDMSFLKSQNDSTLERYIGRTKKDSIELSPLPECSHVARMVNSTEPGAEAPFKMVRQSQPYGSVGGESGLFFVAYANSTRNFDFTLDNMVGKPSGLNDDVMRISKAVSGNYWYVPGVEELKELA